MRVDTSWENAESKSASSGVVSLQDLMRDKYGNYVIQRVLDISNETQRKTMIDKILKAAPSMKKHKSHARHVFSYLESKYGIKVAFIDDDRKSGGKLSNISKTSDISENSAARSFKGHHSQ